MSDRDNLILLPGVETIQDAPEPDGQELEERAPLCAPPPHLVEAALEGLLFAADRPLSVEALDAALCGPGADAIRDLLVDMQERYRQRAGGIRLVEVSKGWQLRTDPRVGPWVAALRGGQPVRLSKAALETLSIVAYRGPVTRTELEDLRGVDSGGVIRMLCERGLVSVSGRTNEPGRPLLYCTTNRFLEVFGLKDLSDLPTLRDLRELCRDDSRSELPGDEVGADLPARDDCAVLRELPRDEGPADPGGPDDLRLGPRELPPGEPY